MESVEEKEPPWKINPKFDQFWEIFLEGILFLRALHLETTQKEDHPNRRLPQGGGVACYEAHHKRR